MKNKETLIATSLLAILIATIATPLMIFPALSEETTSTPATLTTSGNWTYIQNSLITIAFPAGGKKPMFLWWNTNAPDNINVVKFKGLIEYSTYEKPYFVWRCQSERLRIKEQLREHFLEPNRHMFQGGMQMGQVWRVLNEVGNFSDLHAPYLPFSSSTWKLDEPQNVTRGDVKYLSFNFTLVDVPGWKERFQFAQGNIIIRCRFYYTPATEDVYGKYTYTVAAGEFKIDIVIKHWDWNVDKLNQITQNLRELGLNVPNSKAGLALWINLASINLTKFEAAGEDAESTGDTGFVEGSSSAANMYVEGEKVSVSQNGTGNDEMPMQNRMRERFRIRFEKSNATLAGFFKFVPQAIVTDGTTYNTTDVTASYVSAGAHMRLFIGYPYFGNNTLEHDPSLGVESIAAWFPTNLLIVLIGATIAIAVAVAAVRFRKKTVNIVSVQ